VQNAGANTVTVNLSYIDRYGVAVSANETADIPGYSNKVFYQSDNTNLPANFLGAAKIVGTSEIAVIVNFYNAEFILLYHLKIM
ncbi:MAG: hypothetical protein ACXVPU_13195, partial [Bacteroidia bacterium]